MKANILKTPWGIFSLALATYLLWVVATVLLEGSRLTLLRPEAVLDRVVYTIGANIIIGIFLALIVVRLAIREDATSLPFAGFQPLKRTLIAVAIAGILGILLLSLLHPPSLDPVIFLNVYAQVLTVTIAEVAVCWVMIGSIAEGMCVKHGRVVAMVFGVVLSSVLFGIYHFAHSPPFNQPATVLFLSVVGVVTSLVYFIGRDVYATIVFHNFFGTIGVMQSLSGSGLLDTYSRPLFPVIVMAMVALLLFIGLDLLLVRRAPARPG